MKNRQRHGYKQHWSREYRKLIAFREMDSILRTWYGRQIIRDIFVESPIFTLLLKRKH